MSQIKHFEFPKTSSKEKLLESLDTFLSSPEEAWAEFERLQVFSRDNISGDTDTATLGDNRGKNRYEKETQLLQIVKIVITLITNAGTRTLSPTTGGQ